MKNDDISAAAFHRFIPQPASGRSSVLPCLAAILVLSEIWRLLRLHGLFFGTKLKMSFVHNSSACHRGLMTTTFALVCVTFFDVIILCAATFRANKALWKSQFKEELTALVFRVEFLLKIYDTELAFVCFSFKHNVFTSLFVSMPILYHTICSFVWTFAC